MSVCVCVCVCVRVCMCVRCRVTSVGTDHISGCGETSGPGVETLFLRGGVEESLIARGN